jgi:hypothetical protein
MYNNKSYIYFYCINIVTEWLEEKKIEGNLEDITSWLNDLEV